VRGRRIRLGALLAGTASLVGIVALIVALTVHSGPAGADSSARSSAAPRCTPAHLNASAALAGSRVTVSPAPQTRDASATTQISLLGAPAQELSDVVVKGSRSGAHAGRLQPYSQGDGASFVPSRAFTEGEDVSVHADLRSGSQTIPFAWSFTVAVRDRVGAAGGTPFPPPHPSYYQSFHSRPDLKPPTVTVTKHAAGTAAGDLFLAPYSGPGQYGPMILDENGALVWFEPLFKQGTRAADFRVQQYEGKPVLTWWQDPLVGHGGSDSGEMILNSSYQQIAVIRAGNGYQPDLHEFQITPQGTGLITVYDGIDCDLTPVGGARDAAVVDTLLQEIDLKTGLVMFEWHSLDHVPLSDSYISPRRSSQKTPFDFFHMNSIDVQPDQSLLVDARNTWAAYDVDARSGQVRWQLDGKHSSFKMGPGTRTAFQHDARRQPDGTITFFDNGATPKIHPQSRAIQVKLDLTQMTATLVRHEEHPSKPLVAGSQGNVQALANESWMVGWGEAPYLSEFSASGQLLFDAHLPAPYESYRTYRLPWSGRPTVPPSIAAVPASAPSGKAVVYASWNGATEVAAWRVLTGRSQTALAASGEARKSGFETAIALTGAAAGGYVEVQALDASGGVIGVSRAAKL
jgi:hypothetical protein